MLVETFVLNRYKCIGKIFWNGVNGLVDTVGSGFPELPQILTVRCRNHLGFISAWFDTGRSDLWRIVNDLLDEKTAAYGTNPDVTTYFNLPGFVIVLIITWVLSIGINQTKRTNDVMVLIKLAIIVLFIVCAVWYVKPSNWQPFSPYGIYTFQPGSTQPYGIVPAASIVFFSFIGFDAVSSSAEETINPNKTLPRGILLSLAVSTVLYVIMTLIMTGVVPYKEFAKYIDAPVAGVILETGMNWLAVIVNLGALIGMTTVMLVQLYGQSRICYAMSRDGLFPKFFGHVHEKYRTPFKGTWFFGLLTAFAGGFININVLFELVNIGTLSAFIIVSAGILWMRKTQPNAPRGFRAPGVPVTPILAIVFCFVLIAGLNWETWVRFAVWFGLGLIVYFGYSRKRSKLGLEQKAGADAKVAATED